jgi:hypothetical protein
LKEIGWRTALARRRGGGGWPIASPWPLLSDERRKFPEGVVARRGDGRKCTSTQIWNAVDARR